MGFMPFNAVEVTEIDGVIAKILQGLCLCIPKHFEFGIDGCNLKTRGRIDKDRGGGGGRGSIPRASHRVHQTFDETMRSIS